MEKDISSPTEAIRYLTRLGWGTSRPTFYRHMRDGLLQKPPWSLEVLDKYAAASLKPLSERLPSSEDQEAGKEATVHASSSSKAIAQEILEARRMKLSAEGQLKAFELALTQGKYIPVEDHTALVCKKISLIKDACLNWIHESAAEIIGTCHGDQRYAWDVVAVYQKSFGRYLDRLATDLPVLDGVPDDQDFFDEHLGG